MSPYFIVITLSTTSTSLLLCTMKKIEHVIYFLMIWYCSRNGAVQLGTQKTHGGFVCSIPLSIFSHPFQKSRLRFGKRISPQNSVFFDFTGGFDLVSHFRNIFLKYQASLVLMMIAKEMFLADYLENHYLPIQQSEFFWKTKLCQVAFKLMLF